MHHLMNADKIPLSGVFQILCNKNSRIIAERTGAVTNHETQDMIVRKVRHKQFVNSRIWTYRLINYGVIFYLEFNLADLIIILLFCLRDTSFKYFRAIMIG